MIGFSELIILAALAGLVWLWWDGQACKDIARKHGRFVCLGAGVQFLDETVVQTRLRLRRNRSGARRFERRYAFEFTSDSADRRRGEITLLGHRIEKVEMEPYRVPNSWEQSATPPGDSDTRLH